MQDLICEAEESLHNAMIAADDSAVGEEGAFQCAQSDALVAIALELRIARERNTFVLPSKRAVINLNSITFAETIWLADYGRVIRVFYESGEASIFKAKTLRRWLRFWASNGRTPMNSDSMIPLRICVTALELDVIDEAAELLEMGREQALRLLVEGGIPHLVTRAKGERLARAIESSRIKN